MKPISHDCSYVLTFVRLFFKAEDNPYSKVRRSFLRTWFFTPVSFKAAHSLSVSMSLTRTALPLSLRVLLEGWIVHNAKARDFTNGIPERKVTQRPADNIALGFKGLVRVRKIIGIAYMQRKALLRSPAFKHPTGFTLSHFTGLVVTTTPYMASF